MTTTMPYWRFPLRRRPRALAPENFRCDRTCRSGPIGTVADSGGKLKHCYQPWSRFRASATAAAAAADNPSDLVNYKG